MKAKTNKPSGIYTPGVLKALKSIVTKMPYTDHFPKEGEAGHERFVQLVNEKTGRLSPDALSIVMNSLNENWAQYRDRGVPSPHGNSYDCQRPPGRGASYLPQAFQKVLRR